jgi:uncharacterized protein (DUF302 family)
MKNLWLLAIVIALVSCKNDDESQDPVQTPDAAGLSYAFVTNDGSFISTYSDIRSEIQDAQGVAILAEVNHSSNANVIGEDLRNTRVIFFGNPSQATPLLQINQRAGLDFPQKVLVYDNEDGDTFVAFNSSSYLTARHGLGSSSNLSDIQSDLTNFAENATGSVVSSNTVDFGNGQGVVTINSNNDFTNTYNNLRNAISDNDNLSIIEEVDHQSNAQSIGMDLNPTKLIIFGNPNLGTPLMQDAQTVAIDLPQKMLVWQENNGDVNISYNDPDYFQVRHTILGSTENNEILEQINSALAGLAIDAAND